MAYLTIDPANEQTVAQPCLCEINVTIRVATTEASQSRIRNRRASCDYPLDQSCGDTRRDRL
jgi:hypothetical protein